MRATTKNKVHPGIPGARENPARKAGRKTGTSETPPPVSVQQSNSTLEGSYAVGLGYDPFRVEEPLGASSTVGVAHGYARKALRAERK